MYYFLEKLREFMIFVTIGKSHLNLKNRFYRVGLFIESNHYLCH